MLEPPDGNGHLLSPGQVPAGYAELSCQFGMFYKQSDSSQSGLLTRYGIILSTTLCKLGEALLRHFYDKM